MKANPMLTTSQDAESINNKSSINAEDAQDLVANVINIASQDNNANDGGAGAAEGNDGEWTLVWSIGSHCW